MSAGRDDMARSNHRKRQRAKAQAKRRQIKSDQKKRKKAHRARNRILKQS